MKTIAAIIILLSIALLRKFIMIDTCLDHGGRWDYETNECEGETEYRYLLHENTPKGLPDKAL